MPRRYHDDDDLDDDEFPESDAADDEGVETIPCPYCRKPIYEEAVQCPYCENYLSAEDAPPSQVRWVVFAAVICLIAMLLLIFLG